MYVGTQGEKKIWLMNLKQTIEKNIIGEQAPTENINTGMKLDDIRNLYYNHKVVLWGHAAVSIVIISYKV